MSILSRLGISGVRNFDPDEEQQVKFSTPVTLFLGENGCGKTSIIEAIKYAICGELPAGTHAGQGFVHDPNMCHRSETRAQVKLKVYDIRGVPFTVQKIAKVTQTATALKFMSMDSAIKRGDESTSGRCIDLNIEVPRSMGVSKAILSNVIFCHQEDSYWPMEEPKKLKIRFDKIFDSDKYNFCLDKVIKMKKGKMEKVKTMAIELEYKKRNRVTAEKKREQLREKEERQGENRERVENIREQVIPLQANLEEIVKLEREINVVLSQIDSVKTQITHNKKQQDDILSSIKELDWSDEELQVRIDTFQSNTDKIQSEMDSFILQKEEIEQNEASVRREMNAEQLRLGKLQGELDQHKKHIRDQQCLINTLQTDYEITTQSNMNVAEKIELFEEKLVEIETNIVEIEKSSEETEKQLQDDIDGLRTKFAQLEQEIFTKKKHLGQLITERGTVTKKLQEIGGYDDQLKNIEGRLSGVEKDLTNLESRVNVVTLREEIDLEKAKYKNLEEQLQKVDDEISILQSYTSIQTEIDLTQENLHKKQNERRALKNRHESKFESIFQYDVPEMNLKQGLDRYLRKQTQLIDETTKKISIKEKEVLTLEANLNVSKEKLKHMKTDFVQEKNLVDEVFNGQSFEKVSTDIKDLIDDLQVQKGEYTNSIEMYRKFIQSFKRPKPCCPVCNRDVPEKNLTNQIISDIESKIGDFPKLAKQAEAQLAKELKKQAKILELKPMYFKIERIETEEMPALRKLILEQEQNYTKQKERLETLKLELAKPKRDLDLANSLMSDAALLDQYCIDIKSLQGEITALKLKMPSTQSCRSFQDALSEQENLKLSTKESRQRIETLTDKLTKHNDRLQTLKEQRNELKNKELNIKQGLQDRVNLEAKDKELAEKIIQLTREVQVASENREPLKNELDKAIKAKETKKRVDRKKREELGNLHKCFEKILKEIKALHVLITETNKKDLDSELKTVSVAIERFEKDLETLASKKNSISKQIDGLKDQIINKKSFFRELLDNKKLREKRVELESLIAQRQDLESQTNQQDSVLLLRKRQKIERKLIEFNNELSQLRGKISELDNNIAEAKKELAEPQYANANLDFKKKYFEHKTLEKGVKDLEVFVKAVDWAMVQYHKQQMVYINEAIRDLWRAIYRGNDIDYIEIKTEMGKFKSNSTRRDYEYRLVQVKNDVEIEMRGRCSAGQKVLASLVIRIALADTFSTKCGILALDEPTTNLDKENIASLCDSLCDLVNKKRNQKSFQLLIITHDQEFLEKLSRRVNMEHYIHVSRNENGKSVVVSKPVMF